jgi:hypothetical protein
MFDSAGDALEAFGGSCKDAFDRSTTAIAFDAVGASIYSSIRMHAITIHRSKVVTRQHVAKSLLRLSVLQARCSFITR